MPYPSPGLYPSSSLYPGNTTQVLTAAQARLNSRVSSVPDLYSGVVLNQNGTATSAKSSLVVVDDFYFQTFVLPKNYVRNGTTIPALTGVQVLTGIDLGFAEVASLDWTVDRYEPGVGWTELTSGLAVGTHTDGPEVWFTIYFSKPVEILNDWLTDRYRFGISGRTASAQTLGLPVEYDGDNVIIENQLVQVTGDIAPGPLVEGVIYPFDFNSIPSLLQKEVGSGQVVYSVQQGVNSVWFNTTPNPLALTFDQAFASDGITPIRPGGDDISLMFRVLADTADEGVDFLGNQYRSAVVVNQADNLQAENPALAHHFWMSKPNPSRFAVESLYFDMRDNGSPIVIDRLLLEPTTPGVVCNMYYSNDPQPGGDLDSWDSLLWTPVNSPFSLVTRQTFALPQPITCNYVKLEFTKLQARYYAPGGFAKPLLYRKYPKWVLDYFFARLEQQLTGDPLVGRTTRVQNDALALLYQYYSGDIVSEPDLPAVLSSVTSSSGSSTVDFETLIRIGVNPEPYALEPGVRGPVDSLLSVANRELINAQNSSYSIEAREPRVANTRLVSSLDRDQSLFEKTFPDMWFYLTSRHIYRLALAPLTHDRAYFVGLKSLTFLRDRYTSRFDQSLYIESAGDNLNVERNDFETVDFTWVTYNGAD